MRLNLKPNPGTLGLVAEFISPPKSVHFLGSIVGNLIPKSVKWIHSATQ